MRGRLLRLYNFFLRRSYARNGQRGGCFEGVSALDLGAHLKVVEYSAHYPVPALLSYVPSSWPCMSSSSSQLYPRSESSVLHLVIHPNCLPLQMALSHPLLSVSLCLAFQVPCVTLPCSLKMPYAHLTPFYAISYAALRHSRFATYYLGLIQKR